MASWLSGIERPCHFTLPPMKIYHGLLLLVALCLPAPAQPFALIPDQAAARIKGEASTPEARAIIRQADGELSKAPNPLPRLHTEGTLPHAGIYDQSVEAAKDLTSMLTFGLAYRLTGDERYLHAEDRFLTAWLETYRISFNPIDETKFDRMILGYDLTASDLPPSTREKMAHFLQALAGGYLDRLNGKNRVNNWQSHRIKLITLAAYGSGDPTLIDRARQAFQRQVSVNIHADGSVYDFYERDAIHYTVYDLEPLTVAALAAKAHGEDWFHPASPDHPSVAGAIDWLTPYALGEKTHQEFVHSPVAFDAIRARAGLKGYSGMWEPHSCIYLYQLAAMADPRYEPILRQIAQKPPGHLEDWLALIARAEP